MEGVMIKSLPERAHLEQLKKQAKSLLHDARAQDSAALERFRALPTLAKKSVAELSSLNLALHDAQSVIAREYGFKSWNGLREHIEERALTFAAAVDMFLRCATGDASERAWRLLELHPQIAHANLYTELVLGDASAVHARLEKDPEAAARKGGVQGWEPLLYVCHTCMHRDARAQEGLVNIARELLERGANPNAEYNWNWHRELPRTALWGALCAMHQLPLAELLLQHGANPTDGVSIHISAGGGNLESLELLHRYGVDANGITDGVPPLRYILGWATNDAPRVAGVRWLLDHGADPNLPWKEIGDAPIHIAAQRWDVAMVELLVQHGADIHQRRSDGRTAHTLASVQGNREIAEWLLAHGAQDELSTLEQFIAMCAQGDRSEAESMLNREPTLRQQLRPEHHLMTQVPAERGDANILETMLACGFDPNLKDRDGVTALHKAAMAGRPESVRVLLAHGAAVNALDGMFSATPLVWAAEGQNYRSPRSDFIEVARLLIAAGSSTEWIAPEKAPNPERTHEQLSELSRAALA
jgi:ankyrin repeat protein